MAADSVSRRAERVPLRADIDFRRVGDHRYRVHILDFSLQGCRIESPIVVCPDDIIWISLPGIETMQARVCWVDQWMVGVEFDTQLHEAVFNIVRERMRGAR